LSLVAIGDSIPYNSPDDCPGCTGFVDQYAKAVEQATGIHVTVENLTQHTGLTLPRLIQELDSFKQPLSAADVIVVGIAHNSFELNADAPCGRPVINETPDWSVVDARCATESAAKYRPMYQKLYSQIAAWREGKPTILRTINRYSDWIGFTDAHLTHAQDLKTKTMLDAWNTMLCATATANGFVCADIYHAFNGPDGTKAAAGLLGPDYTHPSQRGNDTIERVLADLGYTPLA
jgi:lysophospholipase L1-like esterase